MLDVRYCGMLARMTMNNHGSVTSSLHHSTEQLLPLLYQELRSIAQRERRRLSGGHTLATTALVHEAYLSLARNPAFASRGHFLRICAVAIRRILIARVRTQLAKKRGGGAAVVALDGLEEAGIGFNVIDAPQVLRVHEALEILTTHAPELVAVVECRFFAGLTEPETAEALSISERTVQRRWNLARAWLKKELEP